MNKQNKICILLKNKKDKIDKCEKKTHYHIYYNITVK